MTRSSTAEGFAEDRRFGDGQAHVKADEDQRGAGEERNAPAEGEELVVGERFGEKQEYAAGKQKTDWRAELRKHSIPGALAGRGVFDGQQDGAAPFASQTQTLTEAAEREEQRRGHADLCVGRKKADGDRGNSHGEERGDERGFASDAIAEVAEERRAEGSRDEGDGEGGERGQRGGGGIFLGEKESGKNQDGGGGVNVEIEKLDGGADQAGEKNLCGAVDWAGSGSGGQDFRDSLHEAGRKLHGKWGSTRTQNIFVAARDIWEISYHPKLRHPRGRVPSPDGIGLPELLREMQLAKIITAGRSNCLISLASGRLSQ